MAKSTLALKLTNSRGHTRHNSKRGVRAGIKLKAGLLVKRGSIHRNLRTCSSAAVHVYRNLDQAQRNDNRHCVHGEKGILWLVRIYNYRHGADKTIGTSYKVIRKLGSLGSRWGFRSKDFAKRVAKLLKGTK